MNVVIDGNFDVLLCLTAIHALRRHIPVTLEVSKVDIIEYRKLANYLQKNIGYNVEHL